MGIWFTVLKMNPDFVTAENVWIKYKSMMFNLISYVCKFWGKIQLICVHLILVPHLVLIFPVVLSEAMPETSANIIHILSLYHSPLQCKKY